MNTFDVSNIIEFCKDCGDYQNNMGIRSAELSIVKIRIADVFYNSSLFCAVIEEQLENNELGKQIQNHLAHLLENLKNLEETIEEINTLIAEDTNSAKNSTRSMINQMESYKEGVAK